MSGRSLYAVFTDSHATPGMPNGTMGQKPGAGTEKYKHWYEFVSGKSGTQVMDKWLHHTVYAAGCNFLGFDSY